MAGRGRKAQPEPIAEIPGSTAPVKLTRPIGAAVAALFLLAVNGKTGLEVVIVVLGALRAWPSLRISVSVAGTPLATESITACIMALPCFLSGSRQAAIMRW